MECTCAQPEPTPVEAYWRSVYEIVEWAGQQFTVEQPPLPFLDDTPIDVPLPTAA